ncbi:MAG: DUF2304 domain-containing protein [Candidatus Omnitrophota bacterium]
MAIKLKLLSLLVSFGMMFGIIELVRRRKLKEEYSFLWLITGFFLLILTLRFDLLTRITQALGVVSSLNTLFFFGLIFVILLCLHYSLKVSQLTVEMKILAQKIALLEAEINSNIKNDAVCPIPFKG